MALPGISQSSTRGWILNAPTCAPVSPRRGQGGAGVAAILGGGNSGTGDWGSTARCDFGGVQGAPTKPFLPSPRHDLLGHDHTLRFTSTAHTSHGNPGRSPREIRRIHSNAPSEPDHPLFGLHDPKRKERLGIMMDTSLTLDTFRAPQLSAYSFAQADPPYPDTAHHALSFDHDATMGRHQSEQQNKYMWPKWKAPMSARKPINQLGLIQ